MAIDMESGKIMDRLEDVKALKAEYGIGTESALRYLRCQESLESLRDDVVKECRREGITYVPTQREVSNVCNAARSGLLIAISGLGLDEAQGKEYFISPFAIGHGKTDIVCDDETEGNLTFDYRGFLLQYMREFSMSGNRDDALIQTFMVFVHDGYRWLTKANGEFSPFRSIKMVVKKGLMSSWCFIMPLLPVAGFYLTLNQMA